MSIADPPNRPQWGSVVLTGIFGVAGVLIGAFLQYGFSSSLETEKQRLQIQLSAYADLAKAEAAFQRAEKEGEKSKKDPALSDANLKIRDAAFRIGIFSPPEVVKALAAFTRDNHDGACVNSPNDIALYQTMRRQASAQAVSDEDIAMALFGCRLK
jgi:hypothetical protein